MDLDGKELWRAGRERVNEEACPRLWSAEASGARLRFGCDVRAHRWHSMLYAAAKAPSSLRSAGALHSAVKFPAGNPACDYFTPIASLSFAVSSLASSSVNEPVIPARSPEISDLITGAEYNWPFNTIANRLLRFSFVI